MKPNTNIVITILITFIITVVILALGIWYYYNNQMNYLFDELSQETAKSCDMNYDITEANTVRPPEKNGIYQRRLGSSLFNTSMGVSLANCSNLLPIPTPRPFTHQKRIEGRDPHNGAIHMFAYIFWNETHACFGFTGTFFKSEWYDNINFKLTPATKLIGYKKGISVHSGFYGIYTAIRDQLWKWWLENKSHITHLFITGHSLGGALSTLAAFDFAAEIDSEHLTHYSFGSPRVGNPEFSETYDERVPHGIRVYNTEDIITSLPPATWEKQTFKHVCVNKGTVPFTKSMGSLGKSHTEAYYNLPKIDDAPLDASLTSLPLRSLSPPHQHTSYSDTIPFKAP